MTFGYPDPKVAEATYLRFILGLYGAQPVEGLHIHGRKGAALVHVGAVDSRVTSEQVEAALAEANARGVEEVHVLGWEWDPGLRHRAAARLLVIPREIMERRAVEAGDIRFFERARIEVHAATADSGVASGIRIHLTNFSLPHLTDEAGRRTGREWSDYIDGWAVDWDFRDGSFMSRWHAYRSRRDRELRLETPVHVYAKPGAYAVRVKVTDVFGNDTYQQLCWEAK